MAADKVLMAIKLLSPDIASKIAAGEVVERPASVVKELIENSLDAGARQVSVEVAGGGLRLIRVVDDGAGIPAGELELAFRRHATSKIESLDDLGALGTLGFRGEALPSIAAVADVTLVSRGGESGAGAYVHLRGGEVVEAGQRASPPGTTVSVRHLFAEFPARLKFLKSARTELAHITEVVGHYALAFPEVRFTLVSDGRTSFRSPGSGRLGDALIAVYGREMAEAMLLIRGEVGDGGIVVAGAISPPSLSRSRRSRLSLFVNRRWIRSRALAYAVEGAYSGMLVKGRHPVASIFLIVPPAEVDVNVHPTKREVRFRNEGEVFAALQRAVRRALTQEAPVVSLRGLSVEGAVAPAASPPLAVLTGAGEGRHTRMEAVSRVEPAQRLASELPPLRVMGQMGATYIVAEGPDGMYLIDQHTAHERVLYERYLKEQEGGTLEVQGLLEPRVVTLSAGRREMFQERVDDLAELGFALEPFGEGSWLLRGVPTILRGEDPLAAFLEVVDSLEEQGGGGIRERVAVSLACHSAVKAGQTLSHDEMRELVRQLEATSSPRSCPHGRPVVLHLSLEQVEREFGRR